MYEAGSKIQICLFEITSYSTYGDFLGEHLYYKLIWNESSLEHSSRLRSFCVSLVTVGMMCHTLFLAQFIGKKNLCYQYTDYLD